MFSTSGGLGPAAKTFYKRLASLIAEKHDRLYSLTLFWLCAKLSFSLLHSAIMCLCGSRSSCHQGACSPLDSAIDQSAQAEVSNVLFVCPNVCVCNILYMLKLSLLCKNNNLM